MTFKKEQLRLALTELSIDTIRLKKGDDSGQLIDKYVERIVKIFDTQAKDKTVSLINLKTLEKTYNLK